MKGMGKMKPAQIWIGAALIALVVSIGASLLLPGGSQTVAANMSLLDRIQADGEVDAAYAVGAPLFVIDPNSREMSGIFHDVTTEAFNRLGVTVNWTLQVGYGEMIEGLGAGRYDVVGSGVWINSSRARGAAFSVPIFYDAVFAYTRVGNEQLADLGLPNLDSDEYVISTMDGELGAAIARSDFPNARRLELPQNSDFSQMILNVTEGRADVVFLAAAAARSYQVANPGRIVAINPEDPVRVFPNAIMVPQGAFALRQALNYALLEMQNDGTIDRILDRYEHEPGSLLRVAVPYTVDARTQ